MLYKLFSDKRKHRLERLPDVREVYEVVIAFIRKIHSQDKIEQKEIWEFWEKVRDCELTCGEEIHNFVHRVYKAAVALKTLLTLNEKAKVLHSEKIIKKENEFLELLNEADQIFKRYFK